MKIIKKEYVKYLEWAFKFSYLLLGIATFNSFLYDSPVQPMLVKLSLVLGVLTMLGRVVWWKSYIKMPYLWTLLLFCISFFITIISSRAYGQVEADLKWLIWTGILFLLLYTCDGEKEQNEYKKEFKTFSHVLIVCSAISSSISLYLMSQLYHKKWFTASGELLLSGFQWGRLWGVYTDPNYGSVLSVVVVLLCVYYFKINKKWKKIPYIVVIILNYLYIVFSDSRTAEVAMVVSVCFWIFLNVFLRRKQGKEIIFSIIVAFVLSIGMIGGTSSLKSQYNTEIQKQINAMDKKENVQNNSTPTQNSQVGRKQDLVKDVTNGRFALWDSGVEVWKTSPIVGVGYNSFIPYVEKNLPNTYAINNSQGTKYVSLHNEFVNILVYQGVLGIGLFILFIIMAVRLWWKSLRNINPEDYDYFTVLSSCVLVIGVAMLFLLEGLYTNSPGTFILWSFTGYLMHYCKKVENVE